MSETNTNFRDTSWRKDSLLLSVPHKTHWQVSLKKTGEHASPASLGGSGIWLVCVPMCTVLRPERKGEEKGSSETPPPGLCDDVSEATCSLSCLMPSLSWTGSTGDRGRGPASAAAHPHGGLHRLAFLGGAQGQPSAGRGSRPRVGSEQSKQFGSTRGESFYRGRTCQSPPEGLDDFLAYLLI